MTQKVMKLIDPHESIFECVVCGAVHIARIKPNSNGKYYRGSWQCENKCKLPDNIR